MAADKTQARRRCFISVLRLSVPTNISQILITDDTAHDVHTPTAHKPQVEGENSQEDLCTIIYYSVATSTCGGNSRGWVLGYVQQLLRADHKRTTARSATCQLMSYTEVPGSYMLIILLCIDHDNTPRARRYTVYCIQY